MARRKARAFDPESPGQRPANVAAVARLSETSTRCILPPRLNPSQARSPLHQSLTLALRRKAAARDPPRMLLLRIVGSDGAAAAAGGASAFLAVFRPADACSRRPMRLLRAGLCARYRPTASVAACQPSSRLRPQAAVLACESARSYPRILVGPAGLGVSRCGCAWVGSEPHAGTGSVVFLRLACQLIAALRLRHFAGLREFREGGAHAGAAKARHGRDLAGGHRFAGRQGREHGGLCLPGCGAGSGSCRGGGSRACALPLPGDVLGAAAWRGAVDPSRPASAASAPRSLSASLSTSSRRR